MNKTDLLTSLVITKHPEGYQATARFQDKKLDFITTHQSKELLHRAIYYKVMLEQK